VARGNLEQHEIFLSGLRVGVRSSCARTSRYLRRHWTAATLPIVEPDANCEIEVLVEGYPRIVVDGEVLWSDGPAEDLVAGFEQWLYRLALARHKRRFVVFHAAALASARGTIVFSGPSGAGKSSLALAAVRRGWKYFSDEFVVSDGRRIWGWPRAIRFDPPKPGAQPPGYLRDLDRDDDAVESRAQAAPYYAVPDHALQRAPCSASEVHFVQVERGAQTTLTPLSPTIALKCLTEASFFEPAIALGSLVGADRAWRASWRHPDELIDVIERI
jgi:hypothetical protein